MATLTVEEIPLNSTGLAATYSAAAGGGDDFVLPTTGKTMVRVNNGGGSPITVTIDNPTACSFGGAASLHDLAISVAAGELREVGPIESRFADSTGKVNLTYSGVTSVTVSVVKITR